MDVFLCTGEKSGDQIAAQVACDLREAYGADLDIAGLIGPAAAAAGVRNILAHTPLASLGVEWKRIADWSAVMATVAERVTADKPKLFVAVAHPTFNLPLAGKLPASIRKMMIAPPEIWAWDASILAKLLAEALRWLAGAKRPFSPLRVLHVAANRGRLALRNFHDLLCLTPMNAEAYAELRGRIRAEATVVQVRHPMAGLVRDAAAVERAGALRRTLGIEDHQHLLGIFPGSRAGEVKLLLPTMLRAAAELVRRRRDVRLAVSVAEEGLAEPIAQCIERLGADAAANWPPLCTAAPAGDLLTAACHSVMCSGTLSLQAALLAAPATIAYTVSRVTRTYLRPMAHHRRIAGRPAPFGLPNALLAHTGAGRFPVYPERTLRRFRPGKIAAAVLAQLPPGPPSADGPPKLADDVVEAIRATLACGPGGRSASECVVAALAAAANAPADTAPDAG